MNNLEKRQAEMRRERKQRNLKKRYGMTKNSMDNLVKSLEKQIKETDDPQLKARLTGQLTRVLTVKPEVRAKRSKDFEANSSLLDIKTGTAVDDLPDGECIIHHMVLQAEAKAKSRGGWSALTQAEKQALLEEADASLSPGDRKIAEEYCAGLEG